VVAIAMYGTGLRVRSTLGEVETARKRAAERGAELQQRIDEAFDAEAAGRGLRGEDPRKGLGDFDTQPSLRGGMPAQRP
jgi:hypothetical protein